MINYYKVKTSVGKHTIILIKSDISGEILDDDNVYLVNGKIMSLEETMLEIDNIDYDYTKSELLDMAKSYQLNDIEIVEIAEENDKLEEL